MKHNGKLSASKNVFRIIGVMIIFCTFFFTLLACSSVGGGTGNLQFEDFDYAITGNGNDAAVVITGYRGTSTDVNIPSVINNIKVNAISDRAFFYNNDKSERRIKNPLTSVIIPEGITEIGHEAFSNNKLTALAIPYTVKNIGHLAFSNNNNLSRVIVPSNAEMSSSFPFSLSFLYDYNARTGGLYIQKNRRWYFNGEAFPIPAIIRIAQPNNTSILSISGVDHQYDLNEIISLPGNIKIIAEYYESGRLLINEDTKESYSGDRLQGESITHRTTTTTTYQSYVEDSGAVILNYEIKEDATYRLRYNAINDKFDFLSSELNSSAGSDFINSASSSENDLTDLVPTTEESTYVYNMQLNTAKDLFSQNNIDEAVRELEYALQIIPNNFDAQEALDLLQQIKANTYNSESDFTIAIIDDEKFARIVDYRGTNTEVNIPPQLHNLPVTEIGEFAFTRKNLTSVIIPDGVITIGNSAFQENQLTSVTIPKTVTTIGSHAFAANKLSSIIIPEGVRDIGWMGFIQNHLTHITFEKSGINAGGFSLDVDNGSVLFIYYEGGAGTYTRTAGQDDWKKEMGTAKNAIEYFTQAIEQNPNNAVSYFNRAYEYVQTGNAQIAAADYTQAIALNDNFYDAYVNRADIYNDAKDYEKAIADYNKAILIDPSLSIAYDHRGDTYFNMSDYENAFTDYNKMIEINPKSFSGYESRAITYAMAGYFGEAIADYIRVLLLNSTRGKEAINEFIELLEYNPDYPGVPEALESVQQILSEHESITSQFNITITDNLKGIEITDYKGTDTEITIPSQIHNLPVTVIGDNAFWDSEITSVIIPNTVTTINDMAFWNNKLTNIIIPNGVIAIGDDVFSLNPISSINIPATVKRIGNTAFTSFDITDITVDSANTNYISEGGVLFNKSKTELILYASQKIENSYTIPVSVTLIKNRAFNLIGSNLTNITFERNDVKIEDDAFAYNNNNLRDIYQTEGAGTYVRTYGRDDWIKE
jgi:tetratricopeptide (TPR) repeat protein